MPTAEERDQNQPEDAQIVEGSATPDAGKPAEPKEQRVYVLRCTEKITVKSIGAILNLMGVTMDDRKKQILEMCEGVTFKDITDELKMIQEMRRKEMESRIHGGVHAVPVANPPQPVPVVEKPQAGSVSQDLHLESPIPVKEG